MKCKRKHNFVRKFPVSIRGKMTVLSLIIAISTTVGSLLISYYTENNQIRNITRNYMMQYISFSDDSFSEMYEEVQEAALTVSAYEGTEVAKLDAGDEASYMAYQQRKRIRNYLKGIISQRNYIENVIVIPPKGSAIDAKGEVLSRNEMKQGAIARALNADRAGLFYDLELQTVYYSCPVIVSSKQVATCLLKIDYTKFVSAYTIEPLKQMHIYVWGEDEGFLFSGVNDATGEHNTQLKNIIQSGTQGITEWDGKQMFYVYDNIDGSSLYSLTLIPEDVISSNTGGLRSRFLIIAIVASCAAIVFSIIFSDRLCNNLKKLTDTMQLVQKGNLEVRSHLDSKDEIGQLSNNFNDMMDRIIDLIQEVKINEKLKREAEQNVLATQIEPHFLYNTIDSIQYLARTRGEEEIAEAANSLSELLRSVLSNHDEFITLWEEREYIENYMAIERFKYRQEFELEWDVADTLWEWKLPKLLLQPIVENALIHGIYNKPENGLIAVKASLGKKENVLVVDIQIIDNGEGMSQSKIDQVLNDIVSQNDNSRRFRHVGIRNVFDRIKLIYGPNYGGTIQSSEGSFTCVEIWLPYIRDNDESVSINS